MRHSDKRSSVRSSSLVPCGITVAFVILALVILALVILARVVVLALDVVVVEDFLTGALRSVKIVGCDVAMFLELIEGPSVFFPAFNGTKLIYDPPEAGLILRTDTGI